MPLYQRRQKQLERAAAEEAALLSTDFSRSTRTRILYAIRDHAPGHLADSFTSPSDVFLVYVRSVLLREWGRTTLANESTYSEDMSKFLIESSSGGHILDVIEAVFVAYEKVEANRAGPYRGSGSQAEGFRSAINRILDEDDMAYQVVGYEIVPRDSTAMYANVIAPALSLLHGDPRLSKVESAFRDALRELKPDGNAGDAITDAGAALQEMLNALGARGNALGPLLADARKKDLLGPHDSALAVGVQKIGEWVSADRSVRGDAHGVTNGVVDDAWLAVHVAGALILRLEKRLH